jgi:hypothetical protein
MKIAGFPGGRGPKVIRGRQSAHRHRASAKPVSDATLVFKITLN